MQLSVSLKYFLSPVDKYFLSPNQYLSPAGSVKYRTTKRDLLACFPCFISNEASQGFCVGNIVAIAPAENDHHSSQSPSRICHSLPNIPITLDHRRQKVSEFSENI